MIRTQIQLTEEQSRRLEEEARRSGRSVAAVIRQSVDLYLEKEAAGRPAGLPRAAASEVIGLFRSGKSDVAEKHDEYLEESYRG